MFCCLTFGHYSIFSIDFIARQLVHFSDWDLALQIVFCDNASMLSTFNIIYVFVSKAAALCVAILLEEWFSVKVSFAILRAIGVFWVLTLLREWDQLCDFFKFRKVRLNVWESDFQGYLLQWYDNSASVIV